MNMHEELQAVDNALKAELQHLQDLRRDPTSHGLGREISLAITELQSVRHWIHEGIRRVPKNQLSAGEENNG